MVLQKYPNRNFYIKAPHFLNGLKSQTKTCILVKGVERFDLAAWTVTNIQPPNKLHTTSYVTNKDTDDCFRRETQN
jgi:hypothetical protein